MKNNPIHPEMLNFNKSRYAFSNLSTPSLPGIKVLLKFTQTFIKVLLKITLVEFNKALIRVL